MAESPFKDHRLPSRELSYNYAVAMHFAQQLELNLRAILYIAEYHAFIDIPLTPEQEQRYKNVDGFIDNSTCGLLIEKLRGAIRLKDETFGRLRQSVSAPKQAST